MKYQRGWVGMIVLLLALAIVAWLAKDALTGYGLAPAERARKPGTEATAATPAPANALEAARNLEKSLQQQSEKRGGNQ